MTLHLHRAARTDQLADQLGELLSSPLADPFAAEVVVVPAKGVERWLSQRLSHRLGTTPGRGDGVCAGVQFLQPASLVSLLLGRERDDPWHPDQLVWPLLTTIDESLGESWCEALSTHLGHGLAGEEAALRQSRRWSVARRLAELFAAYAVQRPATVTDWAAGRDTDGAGEPLADDLRWEAELWRRLLPKVDAEPPDVRHQRVCADLRAGGVELDLPGRLSLFGHTRLPASEIELLTALAETRDVHLWLAQPSAVLWDAASAAATPARTPRDEDRSAELVGHPLLASLGRDSRELAAVLGSVPAASDTSAPEPPGVGTVLGWLQADLRANHAPSVAERSTRSARSTDGGDHSVQVHACHGAARQIDVLREVLVGLLEDDPTLEPRDIVVMCPDIETVAPLVSAGFGLGDILASEVIEEGGHPAHRLRVRLADRAPSSTNPLLAVAVTLVELAGGRVTASDVLDLASREPCRRRFGLTDDDLTRLAGWVADAGIRWGIDVTQRAAYSLEGFEQNTWAAGLDRLLLGVAMSGDDHRRLGRGLPVDDIGSSEIELVGRLAELVTRLGDCLARLAAAHHADDWFGALRDGVRELCDVATDDAWQLPQFERELARAAGAGTGGDTPLRLADVRALVHARLAGRPTRANFRSGTLTVCTMVPMRSVPHRVVCLVGLDDGTFPRSVGIDGDDVLARRPLVGERDQRSEDRQLLLDAVLAARETLVITYAGAGEHTGEERPPSVPLGELLDALDRTAAAPVREQVLVRHPLQPYDTRNHAPDALVVHAGSPAPFSFDRATLAGARAAGGARQPVPPFLAAALPAREPRDLTLEELKRFLLHPARAFLRSRLEVATPFSPDEIDDAMPVSLDGLQVWQVGDRLLRDVLASSDPAATATAVMTAEQLRGTLPPFELGQRALGGVVEECQKLFVATAPLRQAEPRTLDVDVDLGVGRRLTGTVAKVYGSEIVTLSYSKLKPKQRLEAWVDLLALTATFPDDNWRAHSIARERAGPRRALVGPLDHRAGDWLRALVALYDLGQRLPLAAPVATAAAWAEAHARSLLGDHEDPAIAAEGAWVTDPHNSYGIKGEDADPVHQRVYGVDAPLSVLLDAGLPDHAWTIWEPLLTGVEKIGPL